ncbi:MAG: dihydrofolate reductase [Anaerolineales bacterium]|nr:dihydrofolate reductase [Anaerolineales bacterium]
MNLYNITELSMVAAVSTNGVIGRDGDLPWRLPDDMKHFRQMTLHRPVIMGRKTYESIGRPLAQRFNIIITRREDYTADGCTIVHSPQAALDIAAEQSNKVAIIGGTSIYATYMPIATHLHITHVEAIVEGDAFFPEIDPAVWCALERTTHAADARHTYRFHMVTYERC